jgi:hypothetical protein
MTMLAMADQLRHCPDGTTLVKQLAVNHIAQCGAHRLDSMVFFAEI